MDATTFHDLLVKEFNLEQLPPDEQSGYVDQIGELVLQGVLIKSLAALDADHAEQLEMVIDSGKESTEILSLLRSSIPGFEQLVTDEIKSVQADITATMGTTTE